MTTVILDKLEARLLEAFMRERNVSREEAIKLLIRELASKKTKQGVCKCNN